MTKEEAIKIVRNIYQTDTEKEALATLIPELTESEDERIRKMLVELTERWKKCAEDNNVEQDVKDASAALAYLEKQKERKPIIQDVELNDAVYDYVRDHFIAGADFTPEYIKKLMENAFFAGIDYYLLKQESESYEPDTNVEKSIENVIRVYGKIQGEWVGGYDVDTLIVNLRRAFNKKEQKPAEWSEEDRKMIDHLIEALPMWANGQIAMLPSQAEEYVKRLKSLRLQPHWKPSEEQMEALGTAREWGKLSISQQEFLYTLEADLKKLMEE